MNSIQIHILDYKSYFSIFKHFFGFLAPPWIDVNLNLNSDWVPLSLFPFKSAPRDHVINLVRNCRDRVTLVVCQPPLDNVSDTFLFSVIYFADIIKKHS